MHLDIASLVHLRIFDWLCQDGSENTSCCAERKMMKSERESKGRTSWQWLAVSSGNGGGHVTRMDQRRWAPATSMWGRRNGQKENWAAADPKADTFKRLAGRQWLRSAKHRSKLIRYTLHSHNQVYKLRKHKQTVAAPLYLVVQAPTDETEVKL
jgi:hypothetical protein